MAHLITAYANFCGQLSELVNDAICQIKDEKEKQELEYNLNTILSTKVNDEDSIISTRKYGDLVRSAFDLDVVMRIERRGYINSISAKTGDLTFESINKLIIEGRCDAWFTIIEKAIDDLELEDDEKQKLIDALNLVWQNLREKDYEDTDSETYHMMTEFIKKVKDEQKLGQEESDKIIVSAKTLLSMLN
jgi:hypothetical protein